MSILILSEGSDKSSDIVCSWLNTYAQLYLRVNREQCFNPQICFTISENGFIPILYVNDIKINLFNFRIGLDEVILIFFLYLITLHFRIWNN